MHFDRRRFLVFGVGAAVANGAALAQGKPLIAAASDLKFALPALIDAFKASSPSLRNTGFLITFGSSGLLAKQIENGAPFHLFFSADETLVLDLARQGFARDEGAIYALGLLSLFANESSRLAVDENLHGLRTALADGLVKRFSIPNPEHAPYGRAAVAALRTAGLFEAVGPFLILGENASQALQFASLAGADGALLPAALVEAPEAAVKGRHARVSRALVEPLRQRMAVMKSAPEEVAAFFEFVKTPAARAILAKYGFSDPPGP